MEKEMDASVMLELNGISRTFKLQDRAEDFYALKDISFSLKKGEVLGVIGKNGAGKSTLLKILGDVLAPTSGKVHYRGNMISILDIGSGFHPDFSGYENIFMNASILGMSKAEVKEKLESIIEFSGIRDFIFQPIRTYSNGMYLRLAFSIAVHLNPQVLLLDEVIAVGDNEFKDKCNSKLFELAENGLTIILVTHNMSHILEFCTRCIWLEQGNLRMDGKPIDVVEKYIGGFSPNKAMLDDEHVTSFKKEFNLKIQDFISLNNISISADAANDSWPLYTAKPIYLRFSCSKLVGESSFELAIYLTNLEGQKIFLDSFALRNDYSFDTMVKAGDYLVECKIPENLLARGVYHLSVLISRSFELIEHIEDIVSFKVLQSTSENGADNLFNKMNTIIAPRLQWRINDQPS